MGSLGLGDSCKYVGKPDSVAIRIPDCSIICHLIDQTGPIVVTSANPTGEADTTHHWQVLAKLGNKNVSICFAESLLYIYILILDKECKNFPYGPTRWFYFPYGLTYTFSILNNCVNIFDDKIILLMAILR